MFDYRQGPGVWESSPIIGRADNKKSDFLVPFRGVEVFNEGDEFIELQECHQVPPAYRSFDEDFNHVVNYN